MRAQGTRQNVTRAAPQPPGGPRPASRGPGRPETPTPEEKRPTPPPRPRPGEPPQQWPYTRGRPETRRGEGPPRPGCPPLDKKPGGGVREAGRPAGGRIGGSQDWGRWLFFCVVTNRMAGRYRVSNRARRSAKATGDDFGSLRNEGSGAASCDNSCDNSWPTGGIHGHSWSVNGRERGPPERQNRRSTGSDLRFTVVARGGVEPPTFRFSVGRSYQLSYLALREAGWDGQKMSDPDRARTGDLRRDRAAR